MHSEVALSIADIAKLRKRKATSSVPTFRFSYDPPPGDVVQYHQLCVGKLVWVLWEEGRWYIGIICLTSGGRFYCQYPDSDQDPPRILKKSEIREETDEHVVRHMQVAIVVRALENEDDEDEDEDENSVADDSVAEEPVRPLSILSDDDNDEQEDDEEEGEEEEEEEEEGEEEEEEEIEVEDWVEEEEEQEEVLEVKEDDEKNEKHEKIMNEFYGFFAEKFDAEFVFDMKESSSHMPLTPRVVRSMMFNFGGRPNTMDRVPTLTRQIKEGKLEAQKVVKMASEGKLKEPEEMLHSQLASERHFANRMRHNETKQIMYCGTWVSQDQLPSKE